MTNDPFNLTDMKDNPFNVSPVANESTTWCGTFGPLKVKKSIDWALEASARPNPIPLWKELWSQGEVCCLFAHSNLGKSIYAVQIANEIAKNSKVIYFDFELSDKQFQLRYTDLETNQVYQFPDNMYRAEMDLQEYTGDNLEYDIICSIENMALSLQANVLIIDNLTWLCGDSEKGCSAARLMQNLVGLKKQYGWSIMVIAHTPKVYETRPLSDNDLAGSKQLFNFFDSVFAIGRVTDSPEMRYIKQLKVRSSAFTYDSSNVIVCEIVHENGFTFFRELGHTTEKEQLKSATNDDQPSESKAEIAKRLKEEGVSAKQIASHMAVSVKTVYRLLKS